MIDAQLCVAVPKMLCLSLQTLKSHKHICEYRNTTAYPVMRPQELVCAADSEVEAVIAYRNALENALLQPAAAHPVEGFGAANLSLAQVSPCDEGL